MINAYKNGKDLYATIASKVYHNNYEDNLEFNPATGKMQPDGKKRRTSVKSLLLGIMYGMGSGSIATSIGCSIEEADEIKSGFFNEFPNVEKWINNTQLFAHNNGYVEDVWGRRRRLPDIQLPKYDIQIANSSDFNPLLGSLGVYANTNVKIKQDYLNKLNACKYRKEVEKVKEMALKDGVKIKDNTGFIAQAERQCVNARIQGGAASMSKRAMINVHNNEELKSLGFRLLIAVHDELIGECPIENVERCKELLSEVMKQSALPEVTVPFKCDADSFKSWYEDVYTSDVQKEYKSLLEKYDNEKAFEILSSNRSECTIEELNEMVNGG